MVISQKTLYSQEVSIERNPNVLEREVLLVLNGAIPTIPAIRCPHGCGRLMMPRSLGEPCAACKHLVYLGEQEENRQQAEDLDLLSEMQHVSTEHWDMATWQAWNRSGKQMVLWEAVD